MSDGSSDENAVSQRQADDFKQSKPEYIKCTITEDKEQQNIFTFKKLQPVNFWPFFL